MSDERKDDREIEIIPPGIEDEPFSSASSRIWVGSGAGHVRFIKLGPFQSLMLGLGMLIFVALLLFFLSGFFLFVAPIVALAAAGAWVANKLGVGPFKRLR